MDEKASVKIISQSVHWQLRVHLKTVSNIRRVNKLRSPEKNIDKIFIIFILISVFLLFPIQLHKKLNHSNPIKIINDYAKKTFSDFQLVVMWDLFSVF